MDEGKKVIHKRWDDGFLVRNMTSDDIKIVQDWYNDICPTGNDLEIAIDVCDPDRKHFLVGELNGEVIASIVNVPVCDNDEVLYCSYFYVLEKYRSYGYGRRINDDVAAAAVGDAVLALDSHDELEEMQKRRGCTTAFRVTLYEGRVESGQGRRSEAVIETLAGKTPFDSLVAYDDGCYFRPGSQIRRRLLEKWTAIPGGKTVLAFSETGKDRKMVGFGCRRPSFQEGNHLIGPLYADDLKVAYDLVTSLTQDITGQKIWINICETNEDAVRLTKELKLKDNLHMIRMYKNGDPGPLSGKVFAITSIDICGF